MKFESIDALQRILADTVFTYAQDRKKAAGRALGTLVELIAFYFLRTWGLTDNILIEQRIPEFANPKIHHNVEFSLHPVRMKHSVDISQLKRPITAAKIKRHFDLLKKLDVKSSQLLSSNYVKRNAAVLAEIATGFMVGTIDAEHGRVIICELADQPFAIIECKRVGVEDGMKKGPQTIEKAKQGAYVARSVSALQKVRLRDGNFQGFVERSDGSIRSGPYTEILRDLIGGGEDANVPDFLLTIGIVSNHGNWFTSENQNKELLVLSQSYDWLLFLTDAGLADFIGNLLLSPSKEMTPVGDAFRASYTGKPGTNRFTKVRIDARADALLRRWFHEHENQVHGWFNVIAPRHGSIAMLQSDLRRLAERGLQAR